MEKKNLDATNAQFEKLLLNMLPPDVSRMPEAKLIVGVISQAWNDSNEDRHARTSRNFFTDEKSSLGAYCDLVGFNASQIRQVFRDHNAKYKQNIAFSME